MTRLPSPGQGIIAVVTRKGSAESEIVRRMDDADTRVEADVEKEVLKVKGGGCSLPVGVHAYCKGEDVELAVYVGFSDEKYMLEKAVLSKDRCLEEARGFITNFKIGHIRPQKR